MNYFDDVGVLVVGYMVDFGGGSFGDFFDVVVRWVDIVLGKDV